MSASQALLADDASAEFTYGSTVQSIAVDIHTEEKIGSVPHGQLHGIAFHDVSYEVGGCREKSQKVILHSARYLSLSCC